MAFRFSLESVLKHRKRQEEVAHRDLVEAQTRLELCLQKIDLMYQQIDETRATISRIERSGKLQDAQLITAFEEFIEGQKVRIQSERFRARELIRDVEDKQEILVNRLHDRKIMEKLKEKKHQEYKERMSQLERKELDDLTNSRARFSGRGSGL